MAQECWREQQLTISKNHATQHARKLAIIVGVGIFVIFSIAQIISKITFAYLDASWLWLIINITILMMVTTFWLGDLFYYKMEPKIYSQTLARIDNTKTLDAHGQRYEDIGTTNSSWPWKAYFDKNGIWLFNDYPAGKSRRETQLQRRDVCLGIPIFLLLFIFWWLALGSGYEKTVSRIFMSIFGCLGSTAFWIIVFASVVPTVLIVYFTRRRYVNFVDQRLNKITDSHRTRWFRQIHKVVNRTHGSHTEEHVTNAYYGNSYFQHVDDLYVAFERADGTRYNQRVNADTYNVLRVGDRVEVKTKYYYSASDQWLYQRETRNRTNEKK